MRVIYVYNKFHINPECPTLKEGCVYNTIRTVLRFGLSFYELSEIQSAYVCYLYDTRSFIPLQDQDEEVEKCVKNEEELCEVRNVCTADDILRYYTKNKQL